MDMKSGSTRPKAFFSYSRADWTKVEQLVAALRVVGIDAWVDFQNITPGDKWQHAISNAISAADAFVLCLSPFILESIRVHDEIATARDRGLRIIPVIIDEISFARLPAEVVETQMLRFSDYPRRQAAGLLAQRIAEVMGLAVDPACEHEPTYRGLIVYLGTSARNAALARNVRASFKDGTLFDEIELEALDQADLRALARVADSYIEAVIVSGDAVAAGDLGIVTGLMIGSVGLDRVRVLATEDGRNSAQRLIALTRARV
jgi:hypothetical protein